jgi:hypothetical protein
MDVSTEALARVRMSFIEVWTGMANEDEGKLCAP